MKYLNQRNWKASVVIILAVSAFLTTSSIVFSQSIECSVSQDCETGTPILSLYDLTNSHASSPGYFQENICCNQTLHSNNQITSTVRDNSTSENICKQNQEKSILSLYQTDDSHVEPIGLGNYDQQTCVFPYTDCNIRDTTTSDCADFGQECVVKLAKNGTNSHTEACNQSNYNYSLCCDVPEPDGSQEVCEWHDGWNGLDYRWNQTNVEYEDEQSNPDCCGDETDEEIERTRECAIGVCSDDTNDWACCNTSNSCSYENRCYDQCSEEDVNNDNYNETCYQGEWKLGDERGKIVVDGSTMGWKTAEKITGADVTVEILQDKEVLDTAQGQTCGYNETECEPGDFRIAVKSELERGERYVLRVRTEKGDEVSFADKVFIYHGGAKEYVRACE